MGAVQRCRLAIGASSLACALALCGAANAVAAPYPPGGGSFDADAQGWQTTEASCDIAMAGACSASGAHDPSAGNPPGSLAATTDVTLNLGGLYESSVVFESPDFAVSEGGPAVLQLERQFAPGGLLSLAPQVAYAVTLIDRDSGTPTEVLAETLTEEDTAFEGKSAAASLVGGHTYALQIEALGGSMAVGLGVLGTSTVRFDNVALSTAASATNGADGAAGASGATALADREGGGQGSTERRRRHVFVKVRCPRRPQRACLITAHGRIRKKVRVTYRRTVRVAKGRSRVVALRIKPRFRQRIARRTRIVVVQRVRIGRRTLTFSRSRALIRR